MKHYLLIAACISTSLLHAMETNSLTIVCGKTTINLTKGSPFSPDRKIDCTVTGRNQQRMLQPPDFGDSFTTGTINYIRNQTVYEKNEDSASDDDTYKPWSDTNNKWENAHNQKINSTIMSVIEPRISLSDYFNEEQNDCIEGFFYYTERQNPKNKNTGTIVEVYGDNAITESSKDLITCYLNALTEGFEKKYESILLTALSTEVGFPRKEAAPLAVATIIQFIKDFPAAYNRIELVVKKRSEFEQYKDLLQQYAENK